MQIRLRLSLILIPIWLATLSGCGGAFPAAPLAGPVEPDGCRIRGQIVSTDWKAAGGEIEQAIVNVWTLPEMVRVQQVYEAGEYFEFHLQPGKYRLVCSATGTRGATFEVLSQELAIAENQEPLDVGVIDLPISKTTKLYGKQAPELKGIVAWQDTPPVVLQSLRGHVVVLDFFAYYCSICHEHKPDLIKLRAMYERHGLVVLALHDSSLATLDEMNVKLRPVLDKIFGGNPPDLSIGLDGAGDQSVFEAYGIEAVPAVILIDQQGRVVRRYHHAGKPELQSDIQMLLKSPSAPML
jgi:thiol-disulfide isomerase/thioredoxin